MEVLSDVIKHVLTVIYKYCGVSAIIAVLAMFVYLYIIRIGFKNTVMLWIANFKQKKEFRRVCILIFYISILLCRTVLCREIGADTLGRLMDGWTLHDKNGELYTEGIENFLLFIPVSGLLVWALKDRMFRTNPITLWGMLKGSFIISFAISLSIELCQLFLKIGSFQLSDIAYNTLGGIAGGMIYYILNRLKVKKY